MSKKELPFTYSKLKEIVNTYPTPFHIYDEKAIKQNAKRLIKIFLWNPGFKEYFAVKATPKKTIHIIYFIKISKSILFCYFYFIFFIFN